MRDLVGVPEPVHRRLRGYAFDPSLSEQLETLPISQITFKVPWERLPPGPVGEYLEVMDCDPAGKCFYEPVELDHPHVLAQGGLEPSEGTPQFHQQMVYAVASLTIRNFERALGRKALWAPGPSPDPNNPHDDSHYVPRLRVYPHALREANAYYSPARKALLFGYFPASEDDPADHLPGSMVFTCLSHDIIAHETVHALLDGMHRRFNQSTNPDMRAFHEAFADIVALFQHFTFPEILRHQIAKTRGQIRSQENLLGQLASQFGRTTGMRGALRDAIGKFNRAAGKWEPHRPDPQEYEHEPEPHARGAILVAAVFDAFLSIYESRTADLLRLYTGGTGVLPAGAVHPDLVDRLSEEATKAAGHVLAICVRALDYCPPVDLTFGEYLRALITADYDLVRDDDRNYRLAFIEAFRRRGIYPRDVRALSVEDLLWRGARNDERTPSRELLDIIAKLRKHAHENLYEERRKVIFEKARAMRRRLHEWLEALFRNSAAGKQDAEFLGIDAGEKYEVHSVRLANRVGPDGDLLLQVIIEVLQARKAPVDPGDPAAGNMKFEGGCTIVADLKEPKIAYCIRKRMQSTTRIERQREFWRDFVMAGPRATYFAENEFGENREPFALLHRGGG